MRIVGEFLNWQIPESEHRLQKFSDAKTLSVSDKLLNFFRFPTTFTLEEPYISRKETCCAHRGCKAKGNNRLDRRQFQ